MILILFSKLFLILFPTPSLAGHSVVFLVPDYSAPSRNPALLLWPSQLTILTVPWIPHSDGGIICQEQFGILDQSLLSQPAKMFSAWSWRCFWRFTVTSRLISIFFRFSAECSEVWVGCFTGWSLIFASMCCIQVVGGRIDLHAGLSLGNLYLRHSGIFFFLFINWSPSIVGRCSTKWKYLLFCSNQDYMDESSPCGTSSTDQQPVGKRQGKGLSDVDPNTLNKFPPFWEGIIPFRSPHCIPSHSATFL